MIKRVQSIISRLFQKNSFAYQVGILVTGTTIAQAIPIAASPILTRLYIPEEFGLIALYTAYVAVITVLATACYDLAITLPLSDKDAAHVVTLTLKICLMVSVFLYLPIMFFGDIVALWIGNIELSIWFYLLPISVLATGAFNVFQYWCNRKSQYWLMSVNRVQKGGFTAISNIALGLGQVKGGMVIGSVIGQLISTVLIGRGIWKKNKEYFFRIKPQCEIALAKRYINHPKHIVIAQLIGIVAQQMPVFIVSGLFPLTTVGFFSMAYNLVSIPSALVANAIGDVYRQRISVAYHERGEFRDLFIKTLTKTSFIALLPYVIIYFVSPFIFELVFGSQWKVAGEYAQILIVSSFFRFILTPLDKGAVVVGASYYIFIWHTCRLIGYLTLFAAAKMIIFPIKTILWLFVIINIAIYTTDGIVGYRFARKDLSCC